MLGGYHIFDMHWIQFSQNRLQKVLVFTFLILTKTFIHSVGVSIFFFKKID
jgi:hypothetical protein